MNFTVIPFFLAANVAINDTNEWIHGPEYTFHVDLSYLLSADVDEDVFYKANLTTTMKCRPASSDQLFCHFGSTFIGDSTNVLMREEMDIEYPVMIKFNERGIMNLLFPDIVHNEKLNTIRNIVKQLSVGANFLEDAHALPAYVMKENYVLGECATLFTILEYEDQPGLARNCGKESNYDLRVLSLPKQKVDSVVVIEKRAEYKRCSKLPSSPYTMPGVDVGWNKAISKMHISANMFKSQTEMHLKMKKTMGKKDFVVQGTSCVELTNIEPAKKELPSLLAFQELATLRFDEPMEHNFL